MCARQWSYNPYTIASLLWAFNVLYAAITFILTETKKNITANHSLKRKTIKEAKILKNNPIRIWELKTTANMVLRTHLIIQKKLYNCHWTCPVLNLSPQIDCSAAVSFSSGMAFFVQCYKSYSNCSTAVNTKLNVKALTAWTSEIE